MTFQGSSCTTHGMEYGRAGSSTVKINSAQAVREGDYLQGAGPPNRVMKGSDNVRIGAPETPIGTATPAAQSEFCKLYCALKRDWPSLTPAERKQRYEELMGQMFARFGAPPPSSSASITPPALATWSRKDWQVNVEKGAFDDSSGPPSGQATLHEIRHAEQTFMAMRAMGGSWDVVVDEAAAASAARQPLRAGSPERAFGVLHAQNELSRSGNQNRNAIIKEVHNAYADGGYEGARYKAAAQAYRDQPGGADALSVEDAGGCGGCP